MEPGGRRGHLITAVARWVSVGLALFSLPFVWDDPRVRPYAALAAAVGYLAFNLVSQVWLQRRSFPARARAARRAHDVVDALAVGLGAAFSGGLQSPIWLLLYPHVVSVAVRGGLAYAMAVGTLDAVIVSGLARLSDEPLGNLHSLTLLFCAFMGGITSSHLQAMQRRLAGANDELATANEQLSAMLAAHEVSRAEQELALAQLQESEERYRRLLGRIQDGVVIIQDGRVVYANEVFARMVSDPEGAFLGRPFLELLPPEDRSAVAERYGAWEESRGVSGSLETHVRTRGGVTLLAAVRAGGVDLQGKRSVIATVRDITLQRRMEQEVRDYAERLETLLEIGRNVVERLDLRELLPLVARSVNRVMGTSHCLLLLRSGDELTVGAQEGLEPEVVKGFEGLRVGESLSGWVIREGQLLMLPDMREDERLRFADLVVRHDYRSFLGVPLRLGDDTLGSLEVVTKGAPRVFRPEEQALMTAFANQVAVALANARLFEEARSSLQKVVDANRRLEELDRLRREYLRNVSHEFRTPLTVIKGYAEFLLDSAVGPQQDMMKVLVESCDRVIDLVETLIEVSRIEQGERERILDVRRLDLREVAETSVESLRWFAARKRIEVELDFAGSDFRLEADGGLLQQVVKKLVDNALKYSPPGARVCVRARPSEEDMRLEVEDSGIGIAAEHLPRIFEKFYTVDGSIARRVGGTGVGLYLVREIVRLHHGSVEVKSLPGAGSVFCVRLPRQFAGPPRAARA